MERIIQIAVFPETKDLYGELVTLTSEGRIFNENRPTRHLPVN